MKKKHKEYTEKEDIMDCFRIQEEFEDAIIKFIMAPFKLFSSNNPNKTPKKKPPVKK